MAHVRVRLVLLALVVVGAAGTFVPAPANAFVSYYSCYDKPPYQWCDGRANGTYDGLHSWDYNQAWAAGINVCQAVYKPSTGNVLDGHGCAMEWTTNDYGSVQCVCYEAQIAQTSPYSRTINGFADADY